MRDRVLRTLIQPCVRNLALKPEYNEYPWLNVMHMHAGAEEVSIV